MPAFFNEENDIAEEDESSMDTYKQNCSARDSDKYQRPDLSEVDEARLRSCLDEIRSVVGDSIPELFLIDIVLKNGFKFNEALDAVLNSVVCTTEKPAAGEFFYLLLYTLYS
jgi:elongation factor 1 alpha-like protein